MIFFVQIITGSQDSTIRLWDIRAGTTKATLTNHKKSVRAMVAHPKVRMFASASPDQIKEWKGENATFVQTLTGHNTIINALAANEDGVLVSGGNNGTMHFWDWMTGYNFQRLLAPVQPGSMDNEAGIFAMTFDRSGSRLITAEADKTIKIYKEDDEAVSVMSLFSTRAFKDAGLQVTDTNLCISHVFHIDQISNELIKLGFLLRQNFVFLKWTCARTLI